jgi:translation initiation factor IF-2
MPAKSSKTHDSDKTEKPSLKTGRVKKTATEKAAPKAKKKLKPAATRDVPGKNKSAEPNILKTGAVERSAIEAGSIAPPSGHLVSAFAALKRKPGAFSTHVPVVTRLAPTSGFKTPPTLSPQIKPVATPHVERQPLQAVEPQKSTPPLPSSSVAVPPPLKSTPASQTPKPQATPSLAIPVARPVAPASPVKHSVKVGLPPPVPVQGKIHTAKPAPQQQAAQTSRPAPAKPALRVLEVPSIITVRELAEKMELGPNEVIKKLMALGIFATINQRLEMDAATIIAQEFGYELKVTAMYKEEEIETIRAQKESPEKLKSRSPIVTVMGHVDHGKTSLLDAIRSSNVATGEAGGITQHIGAYKVSTAKGSLVFLDTPGHEAFTAMRSRGAKVTDIVVLVVSAVDGVMPQTIEAIDHAKAASVPIVVAVNKIDLPGANPQKIRQELSQYGLNPEEWGGKTIFMDVSAKKRLNLDRLLEMIALQAELLDLKANPDRAASGVVLEAKMDPQRGSLATLLVQSGTLRVGDALVVGLCYGKVKALVDDCEMRIEQAGPSTPVELLGLSKTPQAGDVFSVVSSEKEAREIAEQRQRLNREQVLAHQRHVSLVSLKSQLGAQAKDLNIILKADVQGSLQALRDSLEGLSTKECKVRIVHAGLGSVNESDVLLASASNAIIFLFNSASELRARELSAREEVEIRSYNIIYDLIADVKAGLEGLLAPEIVDVTIGKADVREIFPVKGNASAAGCFVRDGKVSRGALARVVRNGANVHEGKIIGLKRFKDDVKEVEKNLECGIQIEGAPAFQKGDSLEIFIKESRTRRLASAQRE